MIILYIFYIIF